jgi:1,4-dihydroxy-2-naphthoyl-CoA hydrolase
MTDPHHPTAAGWAARGTTTHDEAATGRNDALLAMMPFALDLGIELETAGPDRVVAILRWAPRLCTAGSQMHGGALIALADTAGAVCAYLAAPLDSTTVTTSSTTQLLRAVRGGAIRAVSTPLHVGRSQATIVTDLIDDDGRLVARTTQSQAFLHPTESADRPGSKSG